MTFQSVRGNVQTRLQKLDRGEYSALILAAAGLKRLDLSERISRYFTTEEIIPCAGQGILALQGRADIDCEIFRGYVNEESECIVKCERSFIRGVGGECSSPVAAFAQIMQGELTLRGMYSAGTGEDGYVTGVMTGSVDEPEKLGEKLAHELMRNFKERFRKSRESRR